MYKKNNFRQNKSDNLATATAVVLSYPDRHRKFEDWTHPAPKGTDSELSNRHQ